MGILAPVAIKIGSIPWMPKYLPQIVWTDKKLQAVTRGKVTILDIATLPNLMLTVKGRKSGIPRETPLLCVPDGDTWLIAGSYFGGPKMPVWVNNVRAADRATVRFKGKTTEVVPAELSGEDRAAAWQVMLKTWPNFALYEQRTDRTIPVFRLTPV